MVFGLLLLGEGESYPRRPGDEGEILEAGSERATGHELTKQRLPFGEGTRGVKTQEGV
jgi:hypothetical protein